MFWNERCFIFTCVLADVHTHITAQLTPQPCCPVVEALCLVMPVAFEFLRRAAVLCVRQGPTGPVVLLSSVALRAPLVTIALQVGPVVCGCVKKIMMKKKA